MANIRSMEFSRSLFTHSRSAPQQRCPGIGYARQLKQTASVRDITCMAADIQFIRGVNEPSVPEVKLTRSRDGSNGTATFIFDSPSIFEASSELGDITGLYLLDEEGELSTVDVQAKFVNGKPDRIEAKYVMKSQFQWERFMRFMERYSEDKELGFTGKVVPTFLPPLDIGMVAEISCGVIFSFLGHALRAQRQMIKAQSLIS